MTGPAALIRELVRARVGEPVSDTQQLQASGLLDSLAMITLFAELERTFEIEITTENRMPERSDRIVDLVAMVNRHIK